MIILLFSKAKLSIFAWALIFVDENNLKTESVRWKYFFLLYLELRFEAKKMEGSAQDPLNIEYFSI